MKRLFAVWMALVLVFACGCGKSDERDETTGSSEESRAAIAAAVKSICESLRPGIGRRRFV